MRSKRTRIHCGEYAGRYTRALACGLNEKRLAHSKPILQLGGLICLAAAALPVAARAADTSEGAPSNPATAQELPQITVIGNTPLGGLGLPMNQIPSNVQTAACSSSSTRNLKCVPLALSSVS